MDLETAINRIKYYVFVEMGWSKNQLAKQAKVPFNVVAKIHKDDWNPTLERLRNIESVVPATFSLNQLTGISPSPQPKELEPCLKTTPARPIRKSRKR